MKQLYIHGGKAYLILKRTWEGHFSPKLDQAPDMEYIKMYRDWIGADHVLRDQTHYLFCETIQEAEEVVFES
jgi:hypothetical protein